MGSPRRPTTRSGSAACASSIVEAKKPSVDIKGDIHPAYQLRRYAWSAKLPLSILTDFEELAVYDCRVKPDRRDKASNARVNYLEFTEYPDRWEEMADVFSREAVLKGSFDKYVESKRRKRGTAEVDDVFLEEIEGWRDALARNFALRNPDLTQRELNFAVQRTIDRIIFLRICEDRGIEDYGRLQALVNGPRVYARLCELFEHADARYNSGLFHFRKERDRDAPPDELTLGLALDDKVLKPILGHLYYPDSPYEFSVLPADILGQIYEQFLGKVIRLTKGHRAVVEDKPEVKKAGGVYYTPTYIVDYIVDQTVGKLLDGKTPRQAEKLKILDPACGSGSFLLGTYQRLLDWHRDYYVEKGPGRYRKQLYEGPGGEWRLTTAEKKRILLNNIYGVDIDAQAVEVTKLSLLLKVLEGESGETIQTTLRLFHERALPDLGNNIKCGNSLIGPDFYDDKQMDMLDEEERYRINIFDWEAEFPEILGRENPGFDAVIGNPPYGALFGQVEKKYIKQAFASYKYRYDSYIYFVERGLAVLKTDGRIAYITPELWLRLESCEPLRRCVAESACLDVLRVFCEGVFSSSAVVSTIVFVAQRANSCGDTRIILDHGEWSLNREKWLATPTLAIDYRVSPDVERTVSRIEEGAIRLGDLGDVIQGITPYDRYRGQSKEIIKSRAHHADRRKDDTFGKWLAGKDVTRYHLSWSGEWLSYGPWLAAPRDPRFFEGPRLLFREVPGPGRRIQAVLATKDYYHGHSITPVKIKDSCAFDPRYILGGVNSRLLSWWAGLRLPNFGKQTFPKLNPQDIESLPLPSLDLSDKKGQGLH